MLRELERTVANLESGELGIDEALAAYERGVGLLGRCKGLLDVAERKVAVLTGIDEAGQVRVAPLAGEPSGEPAPAPALDPEPASRADDAPERADGVPRPPWEG
jgi:exodeoxyribonuclease VII small subunit